MRRFHPAGPFALALVASLVLFACPPAEEPGYETSEEAERPDQATDDEKSDPTVSEARLLRLKANTVLLKATKTPREKEACLLDVQLSRTHISCNETEGSALGYTSVRWTVVIPPGQDPGAEQVCIAPKDDNPYPNVFAVPVCIDVGTHNAFEDDPDCSQFPPEEPFIVWEYKVTVEGANGEVLCMMNPPDVYIKR